MPRELSRPEQLLEGRGFTAKFYYLKHHDAAAFEKAQHIRRKERQAAVEAGIQLPEQVRPMFHPRITVCLVLERDTVVARGVAICILPDNPSRKVGRKLSARRALEAILRDECNDVTATSAAAKRVLLASIDGEDLWYCISASTGLMLSARDVTLTRLEERLTTKPKEKKDGQ